MMTGQVVVKKFINFDVLPRLSHSHIRRYVVSSYQLNTFRDDAIHPGLVGSYHVVSSYQLNTFRECNLTSQVLSSPFVSPSVPYLVFSYSL